MRLGGPVFESCPDPEHWVAALKRLGYRAAYCPVGVEASDSVVQAYVQAAQESDIVIAEVGAWSNPVSPDEAIRQQALALCKERLALADRVGARCCVNIAGSFGEQWDGPDAKNLAQEGFDAIVVSVQEIIDAVKPTSTYYTLETMPWVYPDSTESYVALIEAIDRPQFAVHFDPVNLVCSPQRYYGSGELIRDGLDRLGSQLRSCHAKDIALSTKLTVHLDEVRPGLGGLDYPTFLVELDKLDPDIPLMMEHLPSAEEYALAGEYIRSVAAEVGVGL